MTVHFSLSMRMEVETCSQDFKEHLMAISNTLNPWAPRVLSVVRIVAGLIFLAHGTQKLLGFPASDMNPPVFSVFGLAGLIELVAGTLITIGLFTRPAAFIASGSMAFAYFIAHAPQNFFPALNGGDAAILYCFFF